MNVNDKINFLIERNIPYSYEWLKSNPLTLEHIYKREKKKFNIEQTTFAKEKIKKDAQLALQKRDNERLINNSQLNFSEFPF